MPPFMPPLTLAEIQGAFPGRYSAVAPVTSGGQGCVYRADRTTGECVALKIYFDGQLEERQDREARALERISADTFVRFVDRGVCALRGKQCIWLETAFIDGEVLSARIARGRLAVGEVARVVIDVASAIETLWMDRIVHRDVKPGNIMLTTTGKAILIDLGLARHLDMSSLTAQGVTWGTTGYMSPEHMRAQRALTCRSDIFSLGVVAQEAMLGRHPTAGRQPPLSNGGVPTATLASGLPGRFIDLIDLMVSRDSARRPLPARIIAEMNAILGGAP